MQNLLGTWYLYREVALLYSEMNVRKTQRNQKHSRLKVLSSVADDNIRVLVSEKFIVVAYHFPSSGQSHIFI